MAKPNAAKDLEASARTAFRGNAVLVGAALLLSFLVNALRLVGPLFMILIYDRVLASRSVETLVALFVMLVGLLLVLGLLDYARRRMLGRFGARFQEEMEGVLFASASRNEVYQHSKSKPSFGMDEVDSLRGFFHSNSLIAVFDFFWSPMFLVVVFILSPLLGWVCIGGVAVLALMSAVKAVFMGGRAEAARQSSGRIADLRNLLTVSRATLRSQDMTVGFKHRWSQSRNEARDASVTLQDWVGWFTAMSTAIVLITRYSVLATGAYLTLQGQLTVGAMVAATFMVSRVLVPVDQFLRGLPKMFAARRDWARLKVLLARRAQEMRDAYLDQPATDARLCLENVSVRSPITREPILRSISLSLAPGSFAEVVGMSSQGKTVLAETILGMWPSAQGKVLINGRNAARLGDADAAALFGYCPEAPRFVDGTIEENIAGLAPEIDQDRVGFAARRARLHAAVSALPDGYQTEMDADGSAFSRFERQQIALARALYQEPELLVFDGFDSDFLVRIPKRLHTTFEGLKERGAAMVVFTRVPLNLPAVTHRFELKDGRLIELERTQADRKRQHAANGPMKLVSDRPDAAPSKRSQRG